MSQFRSSRVGSNVVHRVDFPGVGRRSRRGRRASGGDAKRLAMGVVVPQAPPSPAPVERAAPAEVEVRIVEKPVPSRPLALKDSQARHQIQLLERRLAKMARLLEEREDALEAVRGGAPMEEDGVASIYRDVQGIQGRGREVKRKKALMSKIFEANLALKNQLTG